MSNADRPATSGAATAPPLSWPPPGLESLQGRLWRTTAVCWIGSVVLVLPLLWALAVEQPFYSLGPFEDRWQVGTVVALLGTVVLLWGLVDLLGLLRSAARAANDGYGALTILEVASDAGRDTGFLIQGRRHFDGLSPAQRTAIVRRRLWGAGMVLGGALWLAAGFALAVLLAARNFVTAGGIGLLTLAPTLLLLGGGVVLSVLQSVAVRGARRAFEAQEGPERSVAEAAAWTDRLDRAGEAVVLGSGTKNAGAGFRNAAVAVAVLGVIALVPTITVAVTATIGPILADIAVPRFLSVQEMAGAAEALRRFEVEKDAAVTPSGAGAALQNVAFVGGPAAPEPWEQPPRRRYESSWFPQPDVFPDPFAEGVAADLMSRPLESFSAAERAALRQAAAHPAHEEFHTLARARLVDVVSGRWTLPFPDTVSFLSLPWPRFAAFRSAGLAQVAKAAVEVSEGRRADAEHTLEELISTGLLLIDQGPTLIDNLMGVVLVDIGGDALEAYYRRTGRDADASALAWARQSAAEAARKARAGMIPEDIHALLQGVPDLVVNDAALRGLRWEYFATFNILAPCINLHKMVFGPDDTYDDWRERARDALVRVEGERGLFELVEGGAFGAADMEVRGFLPRFLRLTLGRGGAPGSCASLIAAFESAGAIR